jgi:Asp/Glu/hydantoin racemase
MGRGESPSTRIVWQGFVDPDAQRPYVERLVAYLGAVADEGTEFGFVGLSPPDVHLHRLTETRCAVQAVRSVIGLAAAGVDAVILGHFQDAGLWEARAAVDVPVVGLGETAMLHACTLGVRVGLVTISPTFVPWHTEQVVRYRLTDRVVAVEAMETPVELYMRALTDPAAYDEVRRQFVARSRSLLAAGVEVIVPAGGLPALLFRDEHDFGLDGAAVLNPTALAAKQAELAVKLRRINGTGPSRRGTFALPGEAALSEYLAQVGDRAAPLDAAPA